MSEQQTPEQLVYANRHVAWLAFLACITRKIRVEGLMSMEGHLQYCDKSPLIKSFPQVQEQPYFDFGRDILRLMIGGNQHHEEMQVYADEAILQLTAKRWGVIPSGVDRSLLRTIWLTLWAAMAGYAPQVAIEFGRQAVPTRLKPTQDKLEEIMTEVRDVSKLNIVRQPMTIDQRIDDFMTAIKILGESPER